MHAIGDVATIGVPKAGVFAEGAGRVVAASNAASSASDVSGEGGIGVVNGVTSSINGSIPTARSTRSKSI